MPPTRPETPAPAPEAADPAAAAAAPTPPSGGGGIKPWLPLLITVVLMPVVAFAMTSFILVPRIQKGLDIPAVAAAAEPDHKKPGPAGAKKESVVMNKLLVNVAGTMGSRYLLVSLSLVGSDPDFKDKVQNMDAQLRDTACGALATKTLADLEKPGSRNLIRSELLAGFNNVLGGSVVQEIYLTEFAIQ